MLLIPVAVAALGTLYCLGCVAHRGWRELEAQVGVRVEGVGVELGHAVMGATTLAMLLDLLPAAWGPGALVVFGTAVVGCAVRGVRSPAVRGRYLRLGVLCAAMLPMLVPTTATAAPAGIVPAAGSSQHPLMSAAAQTTMPPAGRAIDLLLIAALLALTAARLTGSTRSGQSLHCRLHAMCDAAMAATTGCMLAAML